MLVSGGFQQYLIRCQLQRELNTLQKTANNEFDTFGILDLPVSTVYETHRRDIIQYICVYYNSFKDFRSPLTCILTAVCYSASKRGSVVVKFMFKELL